MLGLGAMSGFLEPGQQVLEAPVVGRILQHQMIPWTKPVFGALIQTPTVFLEGQLISQQVGDLGASSFWWSWSSSPLPTHPHGL